MSRKWRQSEKSSTAAAPPALPSRATSAASEPNAEQHEPLENVERMERLCETAALDSAPVIDAMTPSPAPASRPSESIDIESARTDLRREERRLRADREELDEDRERLERKRKRLDEREQELDAEQARLDAEKIETKAQRRRIAADLQAQRAEILALRSGPQASAKDADSQPFSVTADATELAALQAECDRRRAEAAEWAEEQALWRQAQTLWMSEREQTSAKLSEAEARIRSLETMLQGATATKATAASDPADTQRISDLQRRFELAVQDVRELKRRNAELEDQLAEKRSQGPTDAPSDIPLDWESQKRRLLAVLENDDPAKNLRHAEQRLTLEGAIHITDEVVAQRDRELAELKKKLHEWENRFQRVHDDVQRTEVIDRDEIIQAERSKLVDLQNQWREKLRQAEIDLSLERAKIARDKAEIEEKLSAYATRTEGTPVDGTAEPSPKPSRGRWLSRLGLKEDG